MDEGLESDGRHARAADYLQSEMAAYGFEPVVQEGERLNPLTTLYLPDGVNDAEARSKLLMEHGIEVEWGLGPLAGKIYRTDGWKRLPIISRPAHCDAQIGFG